MTKNTQKPKMPKLRFSGFKGDWPLQKANELYSNSRCKGKNKKLSCRIDKAEKGTFDHLELFFRYLLMLVDSSTILSPELTHYFSSFKNLQHELL